MIAHADCLRRSKAGSDHQGRLIAFIPNERFAAGALKSPDTLGIDVLLTSRGAAVSNKKAVPAMVKSPLDLACATPLLSADEERQLFEQMNYLKYRACHLDPLEPENVAALLSQADRIRNYIIAANMRLVISIVKTLSDRKHPFDELVSEGVVGLMQAVEKFDYDRGFRFSTYATRAIRHTLYRHIAHKQRDRQHLVSTSPEHLLAVADDCQEGTLTEARWHSLRNHLQQALDQLSARERMIIQARFGLGKSGKVQTLLSLAKGLGVCKERVRQIEKRAILKLQSLASALAVEEPAA